MFNSLGSLDFFTMIFYVKEILTVQRKIRLTKILFFARNILNDAQKSVSF